MISSIIHGTPLARSDHCVLEFYFKCYYDNFNKGDYQKIATAVNQDGQEKFSDMGANEMINEFVSQFNTAKSKFIPKIKPNANKRRQKKTNYLPLDQKIIEKIKSKQ